MEKKSNKKSPLVLTESTSTTVEKQDPLFQIFERHLYEFNYETRENFINKVVREYVEWIVNQKMLIPLSKRSLLETTIADEVSDMLIKKIYGCLQIEDKSFARLQKHAASAARSKKSKSNTQRSKEERARALELKKKIQKVSR